ncbi:MAG: imidazole glycerol phosphate synthase subunit HisH [Phycisphaerae bacterium]|nr:imidazole glycerol phosphate synthase subunit HisH [Phycisphaerae bacterium]MBM92302.1 imidazole glycerol phosphate synthase subunit HisH [Phycisphaerae bacterium]HCT46863.1 imidazole glycerol phosphate synthase subunit HisH [Phycisphaerales bacterium]
MSIITIIDTGVANTASVSAAFERLGCGVTLTHEPSRVAEAPLVVLPGVGSFGAGMRALRMHGLDQVIVDRVSADRPLLGICLGLQLLCNASEESPGVEGLGVINAMVTRFPDTVRTPQHGWNRVGDGYAYYSNTYRIESIPDGWDGQTSTHGSPFVAYLQRGTTLACQFHPELSGAWGANLLRAWVEKAKEATPC